MQMPNTIPIYSSSTTMYHKAVLSVTYLSKCTKVSNHKKELFLSSHKERAHELKEEGNKRFQGRDYVGALEQYEQALNLIPRNHPDRAIFHSNQVACLMQMRPIQHESVVNECTLALEVHPRFNRTLFRRARASECYIQ